jgi:hypothetical protein
MKNINKTIALLVVFALVLSPIPPIQKADGCAGCSGVDKHGRGFYRLFNEDYTIVTQVYEMGNYKFTEFFTLCEDGYYYDEDDLISQAFEISLWWINYEKVEHLELTDQVNDFSFSFNTANLLEFGFEEFDDNQISMVDYVIPFEFTDDELIINAGFRYFNEDWVEVFDEIETFLDSIEVKVGDYVFEITKPGAYRISEDTPVTTEPPVTSTEPPVITSTEPLTTTTESPVTTTLVITTTYEITTTLTHEVTTTIIETTTTPEIITTTSATTTAIPEITTAKITATTILVTSSPITTATEPLTSSAENNVTTAILEVVACAMGENNCDNSVCLVHGATANAETLANSESNPSTGVTLTMISVILAGGMAIISRRKRFNR